MDGELITPRRQTRRRYHTMANSWDSERIVVAIREWERETGIAPRSYEWCPAGARSAGYLGPELSKWEREHPRFPGNTTVYRYFGSWGAALEAAGFKPHRQRRIEGTLGERVDAAKRLRAAGLRPAAIATELDLSETTIYKYLKAHSCRTCGGAVVGDSRLCYVCAARKGNPRRWSEREVLDAVREWERLEGSPPTQRDWRPPRYGGAERWQRAFPRWPPSSMAGLLFGGHNRMLAAAGVGVNHPSWTDEEILAALRAYVERFGRVPAKHQLDWPPDGFPSARTVRRHFGTFTAGIRAAGLEPARKLWSRDQIVAAIQEFEREVGRPPRCADWSRAAEEWPSMATVYNRFDSWAAALEAAGCRPNRSSSR